jgi:hypothetical protein
MSVQVLRVRFRGLSVVVSMDRERRHRQEDRPVTRGPSTAGVDILFEHYPAIVRDTDTGLKLRS